MRTLLLISAMSVLLLAGAACGGNDADEAPAGDAMQDAAAQDAVDEAPPVEAADAANGGKLFGGTCSACHGDAGEGVEGLGKDMTSSEFIAGLDDEEMLAFLKQGRPPGDPLNTTGVDMPPKGGNPVLTDEDLRDIVAFVRELQQ